MKDIYARNDNRIRVFALMRPAESRTCPETPAGSPLQSKCGIECALKEYALMHFPAKATTARSHKKVASSIHGELYPEQNVNPAVLATRD